MKLCRRRAGRTFSKIEKHKGIKKVVLRLPKLEGNMDQKGDDIVTTIIGGCLTIVVLFTIVTIIGSWLF